MASALPGRVSKTGRVGATRPVEGLQPGCVEIFHFGAISQAGGGVATAAGPKQPSGGSHCGEREEPDTDATNRNLPARDDGAHQI